MELQGPQGYIVELIELVKAQGWVRDDLKQGRQLT